MSSFSDLKKASKPWPRRTLRTSVTAYAWPFTRPHARRASMSAAVTACKRTKVLRQEGHTGIQTKALALDQGPHRPLQAGMVIAVVQKELWSEPQRTNHLQMPSQRILVPTCPREANCYIFTIFQVSMQRPKWPRILFVDQAGFELGATLLCMPRKSQVLRLQMCGTMPGGNAQEF